MPLYSAFTPFGHLRFAKGVSRFEKIYRSMRDGQDGAYGPNDVHQEARIYAGARCIAISDGEIERAHNEGRATKTQELLSALEHDYGLSPAPTATEAERRALLALQVKIVRGSRKEAIEDALTTLLGSDFVEVVPMKTLVPTPTPWPASPATKGNYGARAMWRVFRVTESLALVGQRDVHLVDIVANQAPLKILDTVVIGPENPGLTEACAIQGIVGTPTTDANGITTNYVRITTTKPHDAATVCTTAPFPLLTSMQRHFLIRVTSACAADPVKRSAISALMRRIVRGASTWDIVDESGPFKVGVGLLGITPIGI